MHTTDNVLHSNIWFCLVLVFSLLLFPSHSHIEINKIKYNAHRLVHMYIYYINCFFISHFCISAILNQRWVNTIQKIQLIHAEVMAFNLHWVRSVEFVFSFFFYFILFLLRPFFPFLFVLVFDSWFSWIKNANRDRKKKIKWKWTNEYAFHKKRLILSLLTLKQLHTHFE